VKAELQNGESGYLLYTDKVDRVYTIEEYWQRYPSSEYLSDYFFNG
jgi:hypothetical protein